MNRNSIARGLLSHSLSSRLIPPYNYRQTLENTQFPEVCSIDSQYSTPVAKRLNSYEKGRACSKSVS